MKQYKPRDKVTQKITREGAVEENQTTGKSEKYQRQRKGGGFFREASFYRGRSCHAGTGPLYPQSGTGGR